MNPQSAIAPVGIKPMAVIYLRVSTKDQAGRGGEAEGFSIPAQREACLRKAEALGAVVVGEFVDAGESARSANRPELQKMLGFIAEHRVGFVIVHKVDRLARNRVDDVEINVQLSAAGAQLVSCSENIDETPSGMLLHGIMSSIAEFYSRNLATESKKGARQKVKRGGTVSMAPFGYINSRERTPEGREVRTVVLDPDRAHWVSWIYEQYATGTWTTAMIRDELEAHGVTTLPRPNRPSRPLAVSHVHSILKNRYYVGIVTYEGVEYEGNHPRLISEQLFAEVQRVRSARVQSREKPRLHSHYLKGSVYCGACGQPLSFGRSRNSQGVEYDYFYCLGRQRYKNGCLFRAIQVPHLERLVEDHWARVTLAPNIVSEIRALVMEHIEKVMPHAVAAKSVATATLQRLQHESDKLMEAHYADAISLPDLKREQNRIAAQRAKAEADLTKLDLNDASLLRKLDYCCNLLEQAQQHYLAGSDTIRRDLNQGVFEHLYVDDDEIVGSDLKPAFQRLMSDSLADDLASERKRGQSRHVRTSDLYVVPEVGQTIHRGDQGPSRDLPALARRTAPEDRLGGILGLERPRGGLPWEKKEPRPSEDRGSNELTLVAGAGFEPATSGL